MNFFLFGGLLTLGILTIAVLSAIGIGYLASINLWLGVLGIVIFVFVVGGLAAMTDC